MKVPGSCCRGLSSITGFAVSGLLRLGVLERYGNQNFTPVCGLTSIDGQPFSNWFYRLVEINRQIKEPRHFNAGALLFGMSVEDETSLKNRFVSYLFWHTRRPWLFELRCNLLVAIRLLSEVLLAICRRVCT